MYALLYFIVFIEGFAVLSAELLAIRQVIPHVGSNSAILSVIISAVLMPLALGSYFGGLEKGSVRLLLRRNFLIAAIFFGVALSYASVEVIFTILKLFTGDFLILTTLYAGLFLVLPMFLMGQVIPLVTRFFRYQSLDKISGCFLSLSTAGSFVGSVVVVLVLMPWLQLHYTTVLVIVSLLLVVTWLSRSGMDYIEMLLVLATVVALNSPMVMKLLSVEYSNQYNVVRVLKGADGKRVLSLNGNYSSGYHDEKGVMAPYVQFFNKIFIEPIMNREELKTILVIGAGGFTMGIDDLTNDYIYVDIDPDLKKVAEEKFLRQKISENKKFVAMPIRRFLSGTDKTFDLIVLDAFSGQGSIPEHLITKEFFEQIKVRLKPHGKVVMNIIACPSFKDKFSQHIDNTINSVFSPINRYPLNMENYVWRDVFQKDLRCARNILYEYTENALY